MMRVNAVSTSPGTDKHQDQGFKTLASCCQFKQTQTSKYFRMITTDRLTDTMTYQRVIFTNKLTPLNLCGFRQNLNKNDKM